MRRRLFFSVMILLVMVLIKLAMTDRELTIASEVGRGSVNQPATIDAVLERPESQAAVNKSARRICVGLTDDGVAY